MNFLARVFGPKRNPSMESGALGTSYSFTEPALRSWFGAAIAIGMKIGIESKRYRDLELLADSTLEVFWKEFREKAEYERR